MKKNYIINGTTPPSDAPGNSSFPNTVVINPMIPCVTLEPRAGAALEEDEYLGFITDWMKTYAFLEGNFNESLT